MFAHYLAVALAAFRKSPVTTAANVLTLALGLACFITAYGIASYWRAADQHHPNADRIVLVAQDFDFMAAFGPVAPAVRSAPRLAGDLRDVVPELEVVARIAEETEVAAATEAGEAKAFVPFAAADAEIFDLFEFTFVEGDRSAALRTPSDVVITEGMARRFFGDAPALGRRLIIDDDWEAVVTGVIAPVRQPSFMGHESGSLLTFEILGSMTRVEQAFAQDLDSWGWLTATTFARLPESMPIAAFERRLGELAVQRIPPGPDGTRGVSLEAVPIGELTGRLVDARFLSVSAIGLPMVALLPGLGALILLIACVNYANLAAAHTLARAKNAGLRKVLGARRIDVLTQYWLEAGLLTLAAMALALAAVALAAPLIRTFVDADVTHFLTARPGGAAFLVLIAVASSAAAALYPALALMRVRAADAVSGGAVRAGSRIVARILVAVQFLSASFLLIVVTVMQLQENALNRTALEDRQDAVILLNDLVAAGVDFETLRAELADAPQIRSLTTIDGTPWRSGGILREFKSSPDAPPQGDLSWVRTIGADYVSTFQQRVLAGRDLDDDRDAPADILAGGSTEPISVVVDERMAQELGFDSPQAAVGALIYNVSRSPDPNAAGRPPQAARIVGVVAADWWLLMNAPRGVLYQLDHPAAGARLLAIRVARDDVSAAVAAIDRVWDELAPNLPLSINFYDELFEQSLTSFNRIKAAFVSLSLSAFMISTFGLLGVAVHVAARRRHEIGVRKTLGASTLRIIRLLLTDFSKPVLVANLLAWPLGYLAAQAYLAQFAERVPLTPAPFALSMAITLAVAWAAVIGEVLKAASVRPADVLRHA